jgi:hypothetical protein
MSMRRAWDGHEAGAGIAAKDEAMTVIHAQMVAEGLPALLDASGTAADACADLYAGGGPCRGLAVYRVHSRFAHGINVAVRDRLAFIGNKNGELVPYGALVSPGDAARLAACAAEVFYWDRGQQALMSAEMGIALDVKARVSDRIRVRDGFTLRALRTPCAGGVWDAELVRMMEGHMTGFGVPLSRFVASCAAELRELGQALVGGAQGDGPGDGQRDGGAVRGGQRGGGGRRDGGHRDGGAVRGGGQRGGGHRDAARQVLARWLGAGQGLTPSGDDVLTGILIADGVTPFVSPAAKETIRGLLSEGVTTDVGRNQILSALEGRASRAWLHFLDALQAGDGQRMHRALGHILGYGHSSGGDMFAGFMAALSLLAPAAPGTLEKGLS